MSSKYFGRCVVIERADGYHIRDTVTKIETGIIAGGLEEAIRGARNLEQAREDSERHTAEILKKSRGAA